MINHLAIIFPGQGSQTVGMLSDIILKYPNIKKTFDEASAILNYDLWELIQKGPSELLDTTTYTQPALLTSSYAIWQILQSKNNIMPAMLAGHSLGEYTALVCASALSFADAVKLVAARGRYMQEAASEGTGAMAAIIGLDDASVVDICSQVIEPNEVLAPANFNSIGQVVIAGNKTAVERALILAKQQGAKLAVILPVSVASHCQLMRPAASRLEKLLNSITFKTPQIPVVSNVDVKIYSSPDEIRHALVEQLYKPVRWVETIQFFVHSHITEIIECGPGKVLSGLNKRINKNLKLTSTSDANTLEALLLRFSNSTGGVAGLG